MKKHFLIILFLFTKSFSYTQTHEVGFSVGGTSFLGDIGNMNYLVARAIGAGVIYKYNINPRIALRGNYNYLGIKGNDINSSNLYRKKRGYHFSNYIHEISTGIEFNFFKYNIQNRKTSFTPYILAQVAAYSYKYASEIKKDKTYRLKNTISFTAPVGVGIKGRLIDNIAFAFESAIRLTIVDNIDYTTPKIKELNFGGYGNDTYIFTAFSIVYFFGRKPCYAYFE